MNLTATKITFQKYPAYKGSGEYWMGEIPEHWEIKKLKHIFKEKKKVTNPSLGCGSISFGKVVFKDDEKIPEATKASYQEVLAGEYLVNPLNLNYDLISLRIGLSDINVVVSSGYIVLKNSIELDKSFFNYLLHRYDVAYMKLLGSGVRQTISFNHIANSLLAFPPIPEQTAIANFLDDKTAKIDQAIAQKEKLIALLKEWKQIIIQNAVTKGLDPNVKLKDSGVEWIGEIPEHWEVTQIKRITKTTSGSTPQSGNVGRYYNGSIPWVRTTDLNNDELLDVPVKITEAAIRDTACSLMPVNTVCVAMYGGPGTIGKHSILRFSGTINQALCGIMPSKKLNQEYLYYYVKYYRPHWMLVAKGSRVDPNISQDEVRKMFIPLLSVHEQVKIAAFIETQSSKVNQAITLQQTQIEKLKEYKATLIDSAVTGKIKVPGV
ncbi:restriction endonuclease subunit S [Cyclobacterium jeungdonense]|uniref:Restriction endonuclease subunit S n=1 Tax=Cyclobacterium jeungdonense TaxID=708087 RepID=A0ABT8CAD4_9BACT|nr:restriction endonuclease subunit S [Cyclobacterium jeungdonense]MDN3689052.1 restriction endonuclease subunit S [Cyclobacterium jeungdonense]